jgi:hypothetical protein
MRETVGGTAALRITTHRRSRRRPDAVAGAPANARKVIELQVKKGARWMTFRTTRLRAGKFSAKFRFTATHGVKTYRFRARVRAEAGFPFSTGISKQTKVTVRG